MDEKLKQQIEESSNPMESARVVAEAEARKARRERHAELKSKIEENEGILDRKRIAINEMRGRYMHGLIDLTYFSGSSSLRDRAEHERQALHKIVDEVSAACRDYDDGIEANQKLVDEAHKLCEEIEKDEGSGFSGFAGGLLGGAAAYLFGSALSKVRDTAPKTEPAPPPSSGGESGGGDPYDAQRDALSQPKEPAP